MKAQSAPSSAITLTDVVGLIKDLMDKLTGKKATFWLNSFKRFLRKENPWPPVRILFSNKQRLELWRDCRNIFKAFEETGFHVNKSNEIDINSSFPEFEAIVQEYDGNRDFLYTVVGIRVADLLNPLERMNMTYNDMLAKAKTFGFYPCDVLSGLVGVISLIGDQTRSLSGQPLNFVICSLPFVDADKITKRLYQGIIWAGEKCPDNRGSAFRQTIGQYLDENLRFELKPDCLMLFISVNE